CGGKPLVFPTLPSVFHDPARVDKAVAEHQATLARKGSCRGTRTRNGTRGPNPVAGLAPKLTLRDKPNISNFGECKR
ncbi:MAG TPA: hypothetical protein VFE61_04740, partial [Candidatus Sulfotelmatobacter sp.]|nr:hypothetical protein [Candidatus Sulfotelmatobacter sp.]